jgi:FkbM family methyltransferase
VGRWYEPHVRECFDALLKPGDAYLDVGAHVGFHAVFAGHRVGPKGHVFAFEAGPEVYKFLARNLAQFPWSQAVPGAVWEHSGKLTFERSSVQQESGWGTVCAVRDFGKGEHVSVQAIALDDFCRDTHVTRLDAMKLDAEGSELAVLRGAQTMLGQFCPVIIIEINGILLQQAGTSSMEVADFLAARSYRLFKISYRRLERWDQNKHAEFSDALCLPESRAEASLERLVHAGFKIDD